MLLGSVLRVPSVQSSGVPIDKHVEAYDYLEQVYPRLWLALYHHRESRRGDGLEFHNRPWIIPIYKDDARQIVVMKPSQIGVSEWIYVSIFNLARQGYGGMDVFPRDVDAWKVVPDRIDRLIARADFYRENCSQNRKDIDTKGQKTLFGVNWYFVGANSESNFYTVPVDVLVIDEFDKCNQRNLVFAYDRIESSKDPHLYIVGNPTIAGAGIHQVFTKKSDKKQWFIRCEHCGERQSLDWFKNVVQRDDDGWKTRDGNLSYEQVMASDQEIACLCQKCGKPIDRLGAGEWVAEFPGRDASGYHCSKLFGDPRSAALSGRPQVAALFLGFIDAQANPDKLQRFYNNVLGIPYEHEGTKLTQDILASCSDQNYTMPQKATGTYAGVDLGSTLHTHISRIVKGKRQKVFIGRVPSYSELDSVFKRFGVTRAVLDAGGDIHAPREFQKEHKYCYLCYYNKSDQVKKPYDVDPVKRIVRSNRTESLDAMFASYVNGDVILPGNWQGLDGGDYVSQMLAPVRVYEKKSDGSVVPRWEQGALDDHHFHADNYEYTAVNMMTMPGVF